MAFVTVDEIQTLMGVTLTPTQRARAQLRIDAVVEQLELWARQKFEAVQIFNEKHILSGSTNSIFLRWGEANGEVDVRWFSQNADPQTMSGDWWGALYAGYSTYWYGTTASVYITYVPDVSRVEEYASTIKNIIVEAVINHLMTPDAVTYKVINQYSVEGLSISFANGSGQEGGQNGLLAVIDLSPLSTLKRRLIV